MKRLLPFQGVLLGLLLGLLPAPLWAATSSTLQVVQITITQRLFLPDRHEVSAGQPILLVIHNADRTPEEFESPDLNREKMLPAGATIHLYLPGLPPGDYRFHGAFNPRSAVGTLRVRRP